MHWNPLVNEGEELMLSNARCRFWILILLVMPNMVSLAGEESADDALREAVALLEARREAITDRGERKRLDDGIAALKKTLRESKEGWSWAKITPVMLREKLKGKATFNSQSKELSIAYDFASEQQLKDFSTDKANPIVARRVLSLEAGDKITHCVPFQTLTMSAVLGLKKMKGRVISTTEGTAVGLGGANPDTVYFNPKDAAGVSLIVPANVRSGSVPIAMTLSESKATFQFGNDKLGREVNKPGAGQLVLSGGEIGFNYASLLISGTVDEKWAAEFFK